MSLGHRLKQLREEKGLTQEELGKVINVSKPSISRYEAGTNEPNTETLKQLAIYFYVSLDYLMGLTDIRNLYTSTDKISNALEDDKELSEFWNVLKEREDLKLLFKQTKDLAPKDINQIMRIIKAIEDEEDRNDG